MLHRIKRAALAAAIVAIALAMSGCMDIDYSQLVSDMDAEPAATAAPLTEPMYEDAEALYQYYIQVSIGDTLADLTAKFGEPTSVEERDEGSIYSWKMADGYGFAAAFFDSGRLRAKVVHYEDIRQLSKLSAATGLDYVSMLSKEYTFEMVNNTMGGSAMEIAQFAQDGSVNPEVKTLYAWLTEGGSCVQILFSAEGKYEEMNLYLAQ